MTWIAEYTGPLAEMGKICFANENDFGINFQVQTRTIFIAIDMQIRYTPNKHMYLPFCQTEYNAMSTHKINFSVTPHEH